MQLSEDTPSPVRGYEDIRQNLWKFNPKKGPATDMNSNSKIETCRRAIFVFYT